jgi:hypothetical protein
MHPQAVGQDPHRNPLVRLAQQAKEGGEIGFFMKHLLPSIAAIEHMVAIARRRGSMWSCHAAQPTSTLIASQQLGLTPFFRQPACKLNQNNIYPI